jgi:hypothetical protein
MSVLVRLEGMEDGWKRRVAEVRKRREERENS